MPAAAALLAVDWLSVMWVGLVVKVKWVEPLWSDL